MTALPVDLSYVTRVNRQPLYFASKDSTLFGWLHMPRESQAGDFGMVLCPPLGIDYVNTYPALRHLADRLAARGIPVLRFDYSGTGNSSGFDFDGERVKHWIRDIRSASETLQHVTGCARTGLFGVRIGALLATAAAHEHPVDCLALWGPVTRGRAYMREMRAMYLTGEGPQADVLPEGSAIEAGGFVFSAQTVQDLSGLTLEQLQPNVSHVLYAARDDLPADQSIPASWVSGVRRAEARTLPGFSGMLVSPHNSQYRYPHSALLAWEQWIVDCEPATPEKPTTTSTAPVDLCTYAEFRGDASVTKADVRESVFRFGEDSTRFALISEPMHPGKSQMPWIVLSNSGALHTAGPNRIYTLLARELARAGMYCVRMDFPGVGDSVIAPPEIENRPYQPSNSDEIASLLTALQQERGAHQFVLCGLCSGAFASFHGLLDLKQLPIVEGVLINPLTFYWKEGMSLDEPPPAAPDAQVQIEHLNLWQYYLGRMRDPRSWRNLLTARSDTRQLLVAMFHRIRLAVSERLGIQFNRGAVAKDEPLTRDIRDIVDSGRKLAFVFARSDPGYGLLMAHAGAEVRRLQRKKRLAIWFIDGTNHTFANGGPRKEFIRSLVEYLRQTYRPRP